MPDLIKSTKSMRASIRGYLFLIEIHRPQGAQTWTLEVIDPTGISHILGHDFITDRAARDTALHLIETDGLTAFPGQSNVIPLHKG